MARPTDVRTLKAMQELAWYQAWKVVEEDGFTRSVSGSLKPSQADRLKKKREFTDRALELNLIIRTLKTHFFVIIDEVDVVLNVSDSVVLPIMEDFIKLGKPHFVFVTRAFMDLFLTDVLLNHQHCLEFGLSIREVV